MSLASHPEEEYLRKLEKYQHMFYSKHNDEESVESTGSDLQVTVCYIGFNIHSLLIYPV
jgi:hypothetical protein